MVLDYADSKEKAMNYLINNRTTGWNFVLSDVKVPIGYVTETTANYSYVGTYDSYVESINLFGVLNM